MVEWSITVISAPGELVRRGWEHEASPRYILKMSQNHKQQQKTIVFGGNVSRRQNIVSMYILSYWLKKLWLKKQFFSWQADSEVQREKKIISQVIMKMAICEELAHKREYILKLLKWM